MYLSHEIRSIYRYNEGAKLAGVLYFHRISDRRMGGISRKNFSMFRKLCGEKALQNVVIVTNMWEDVHPEIGEAREAELKEDNMFFKPALDKHAKIARHDNTCASAERIIRSLLNKPYVPLCIQQELVDEKKEITETSAGQELNRDLNEQIERHKLEMRELNDSMEQAMWADDPETRGELEIDTKKLRELIEKLQNDSDRLESDYKKEKARFEVLMQQKEKEAREEMERVRAQYQREIERLTHSETSPTSQHQKQAKINELREKVRNTRPNIFSRFGGWVDRVTGS